MPTLLLLLSLSLCQLLTGLCVTTWGVYPTLTECWPFGRQLCQLQAVMRGALRQQNSLCLVLLAVDRYLNQAGRGWIVELQGVSKKRGNKETRP